MQKRTAAIHTIGECTAFLSAVDIILSYGMLYVAGMLPRLVFYTAATVQVANEAVHHHGPRVYRIQADQVSTAS